LNGDGEFDSYKVALGSIHLTLQNILSTIIGLLGFAFLARMITQEEMGIIAALTFLTSLVQIVSDFGLHASLAKFVSESMGKREDFSIHVLSSLGFRLLASLLATCIVLIFPKTISIALFDTEIHSDLVRLSAVNALILSLSSILVSVSWGSGKLGSLALYGVFSTMVRWLLVVFFLHSDYGIDGVILGWIFGDIVLFLLFLFSVSRMITFSKTSFFKIRRCLPSLLRFSWPLYMASIISFVYTWYDRALVLAYFPLADLGVYDISQKAFSVLTSIGTALGTALFPYYGMAYGRGDHGAISLGIKRGSKYAMITIFPLTMGLFATSKPVITLFAGQQYEPGWPLLATLSLFGLVFGLSSAFSNLLLIYGKTRIVLVISSVSVILSLCLLPLLSILNLVGFAIIRGFSMLLSFLLSVYALSKILTVEIDSQALMKVSAASMLMTVVVITVQQFYYSEFLLPFYALVGAFIYASSLKLLKALDPNDLQLLKRIVGDKIAKYVTKVLGYSETPTKD